MAADHWRRVLIFRLSIKEFETKIESVLAGDRLSFRSYEELKLFINHVRVMMNELIIKICQMDKDKENPLVYLSRFHYQITLNLTNHGFRR